MVDIPSSSPPAMAYTLKDKDYLELWRYFQDRADNIKEAMFRTVTWTIGFAAALLGFLITKLTDFDVSKATITIPWLIVITCVAGLIICIYSFMAINEAAKHIRSNWAHANRCAEKVENLIMIFHGDGDGKQKSNVMKIWDQLRIIVALFATAFVVIPGCVLCHVSCAQRNFDSTTEGQKLLRRDAEWADLATAGKDIDKVVSYWSDDAIVIFPGQPLLEGKAAIRAYVAASFNTPGFKIHWASQKPIFSPDGKLAYMRGTDELTVPGPNGGTMTVHLRGISVWRVDPDGQWRCAVDISNEEPPAAPKS